MLRQKSKFTKAGASIGDLKMVVPPPTGYPLLCLRGRVRMWVGIKVFALGNGGCGCDDEKTDLKAVLSDETNHKLVERVYVSYSWACKEGNMGFMCIFIVCFYLCPHGKTEK
ncbi:hypothetical protein Tco_1307275 [Tanacetum coccineum]